MTYNELEHIYTGYILKASKEDWLKVDKTKGNCIVKFNTDDYDEEVYFDVVYEDKGE